MKAMIFAAGLGTRLQPITNEIPKALVEVCGEPMLGRVIRRMKQAGVTEIVINIHHFAQKVIDYVASENFSIPISFSYEQKEPLETGGGILHARGLLLNDLRQSDNGHKDDTHYNGPIIVYNADILSDFPIEDMAAQHQRTGALATLLAFDRHSTRTLVFTKKERQLVGWERLSDTGEVLQRKPQDFEFSYMDYGPTLSYPFGGVHIISSEIFPLLEDYSQKIGSNKFSIMDFYLENTDKKIIAFSPLGQFKWFDIGSVAKLKEAEEGFCSL